MSNSVAMIVKQFITSKHLPWIFAAAAAVMMLPSLKTGLVMDDLLQRIPQLKPSQIPPALYQTGVVPDDPGQLSTVLFETFGFPRDETRNKMLRDYGLLPWWFHVEARCALWRPFTAFTHWLDYRIFPDSPALMHAHNIAWFTAVVFLAAIIYRKIIGPTGIAALAALMFVLDKNTYFPVMFVANRGFIVALCLGLICFLMHHKWRSTGSSISAILSVIFFSLSILANEAGVSTFAFILAYALVLDKASWPKRFSTLLPAILIIIIWRIIYQSLGYGVSGIGEAYLDPGREPLKFLYHFPGYFLGIIAGQLSALSTEIFMAVNLKCVGIISMFYIGFNIVAIVLFLPIIFKNTLARFWFAVMIFAAIPVVAAPSGKNFGFIAIGAFGFIVVFANDLFKNKSQLHKLRLYKYPARTFCVILLIAHIPLSAVSKLIIPKVAPVTLNTFANPKGLNNVSLSNDSNVVIVNATSHLSACAMPTNAAYYDQPIPKSIRALAFAYSALEIERTGENSIVIRSKEKNIFTADQSSPLHFSHAFVIFDRLLFTSQMFEKNRRFALEGMTVDVLATDNNNLPKELAYTFDAPLEHKNFRWLKFNWHTFSYEPFTLPKIGQTVVTDGPPYVRFTDAMRFLLRIH